MPPIDYILFEKAQAESDAPWHAPHTITVDGRELTPELSRWLLEAAHDDYHLARAQVLRKGHAKAGKDAWQSFNHGHKLAEFLKGA